MGIRNGIKKIFSKINETVMVKRSRESVREAHTRRRVNTLLSDKSNFNTIEAYKAIRTNIIFTLGTSRGCKKIIVTSAIPGEGKTTTCMMRLPKTTALTKIYLQE